MATILLENSLGVLNEETNEITFEISNQSEVAVFLKYTQGDESNLNIKLYDKHQDDQSENWYIYQNSSGTENEIDITESSEIALIFTIPKCSRKHKIALTFTGDTTNSSLEIFIAKNAPYTVNAIL